VRITRTQLVDAARREVEQRAEANGLVAAYLIGSLVHDQAVFGGAADIDLVLIHEQAPGVPREIVGLTDDVHLDIAHHHRDQYAQPRLLRLDPWLGPAIYDPLPLHDPQHFFEWAQASARGQFLRADHRAARASTFLERARRIQAAIDSERPWLSQYARAALSGANAIATLGSQPAAGRRLLPLLEAATAEAGCPEAHARLLRLLGAESRGPHDLAAWVSAWARAFDAGSPLIAEPALLPERRGYYLRGFQAQLESDTPHAVLFTLLDTWERILSTLEAFAQAGDHRPAWEQALEDLDLTAQAAARRLEELETYLDHLEAFVEEWSTRHGA
jgi:hypothetical protein